MVNTQFFIAYLEHFSYVGIFVLVLLSGYVIPIPEEIILLLTGYIAGLGFNNLYFSAIAAILGVIAGDNLLFWLSKYGSSKLVNKLKKNVRKNEIWRYKQLMKKHIGKTIFILRFIAGLRFLSPFLAASMKIKWKTFQVYNFIATLVYVPIFVFIGYHFRNKLAMVVTEIDIARHLIFFFFLLIASYLISIFINRRFLIKNKSK